MFCSQSSEKSQDTHTHIYNMYDRPFVFYHPNINNMPSGPKKRKAAKNKQKSLDETLKNASHKIEEEPNTTSEKKKEDESIEEEKTVVDSEITTGNTESALTKDDDDRDYGDIGLKIDDSLSESQLAIYDDSVVVSQEENPEPISSSENIDDTINNIPIKIDDMQMSESVETKAIENLPLDLNFKTVDQVERIKKTVLDELHAVEKVKALLEKVLEDLNGIKLVDDGGVGGEPKID